LNVNKEVFSGVIIKSAFFLIELIIKSVVFSKLEKTLLSDVS
jgi:hypothetical protein